MHVALLTKEYPPHIYGGAGVHVSELVRALRALIRVDVHCFGPERDEPGVFGYADLPQFADANASIATMATNLAMVEALGNVQLVHSHTWYANFAGRMAALRYGIGHVMTSHSLEPLRPWKAEQLGGGYRISSDIEWASVYSADAIIAVSHAMAADLVRCYPDLDPARVHPIHNGIDTDVWKPGAPEATYEEFGLDPDRPLAVFVGRITRQKGLPYLLEALHHVPDDVQIVLCAGAPDTPEIGAEVADQITALQAQRSAVIWVNEHLDRRRMIDLLTAADVFMCPSVYEPLGIVNLEAMACGTAVVATRTGGIPEVVVDGQTGWLVPIDQTNDGTGTPTDVSAFVNTLAAALTDALADRDECARRGAAGRARAEQDFAWTSIASQTVDVYRHVIEQR